MDMIGLLNFRRRYWHKYIMIDDGKCDEVVAAILLEDR